MDPVVIAALIWMIAAPVFLVLWLLGRRKLNKLIADTQRDADLNRAALKKGEADHNATKAKYSSIISQEAEVARLQAIAPGHVAVHYPGRAYPALLRQPGGAILKALLERSSMRAANTWTCVEPSWSMC